MTSSANETVQPDFKLQSQVTQSCGGKEEHTREEFNPSFALKGRVLALDDRCTNKVSQLCFDCQPSWMEDSNLTTPTL